MEKFETATQFSADGAYFSSHFDKGLGKGAGEAIFLLYFGAPALFFPSELLKG